MKKTTNLLFMFLIIMMLTFTGCEGESATLRLATTTSTADSGLLAYLLPVFEQKYHVKVDVLAQGTGQAIETAARGDADIILVHAKKAEEKFVAEGDGIERFDVMYNDFVVVGPKNDPSKLKGKPLDKAFIELSTGKSVFISRGDDSGTNKKELEIWQKLMLDPKGDWYLSIGKGMGDTLIMANEQKGYTLTDRATFSFMKAKLNNLDILVEGDAGLLNPYGVIAVNPDKHQGVNIEAAQKFIVFLLSAEGQQLIKDYKVNGQQLFFTYEK